MNSTKNIVEPINSIKKIHKQYDPPFFQQKAKNFIPTQYKRMLRSRVVVTLSEAGIH